MTIGGNNQSNNGPTDGDPTGDPTGNPAGDPIAEPIGPDSPNFDQRMIAPPNRPTHTAWAATYPSDPLAGSGYPGPHSRTYPRHQRNLGHPNQPTNPDPGSRSIARWAWIAFLLSLFAVIVSQQLDAAAAEKGLPPDPTVTPAQRVGPPAMDDPFDISARLFTKLTHSGMQVTDADKTTIQGQIQQAAQTPVDKFRAAVVVGEVLGRFDDAEKQLAKLEETDANTIKKREGEAAAPTEVPARATATSPTPAPTLAEQELDTDIALVRTIWDQGPEALTTEQADRLAQRHGWYAKLLTTHGQTFQEGQRAKMVANARWIVVLMLGAVIVFATAFFGGIIAAAVMGYLISQGKIKPLFRRPLPGGSIYLETAAVFVFSFLLFKLAGAPLLALVIKDQDSLMGAVLASQWLLLPTIFWPILRGVSFKQWRADVGIAPVEGRSILREIGAGIFGYFAGLPILALAMVITILIVFGKALFSGGFGGGGEGGAPTAPHNPIAEMISQAPLWQLVMLFALATVWAPIVEECIFRGCFFRHLRSRIGVLLAALLSAGAFAFMHGYAVLMLLPVFTIGFIFAFIREWRGSIVSTITAHALHNATVLTLVGALFMILRG
jgi:membrane protease YdiL (CAAX protease family)